MTWWSMRTLNLKHIRGSDHTLYNSVFLLLDNQFFKNDAVMSAKHF